MINTKRSSGIIVVGDKTKVSVLSQALFETIKYPIIDISTNKNLKDFIKFSTGKFIFTGATSLGEVQSIIKLIKDKENFDLVILDPKLTNQFKDLKVRQHLVKNSKDMFIKLSPHILLEEGMAEGYFALRKACNPEFGEHIFISGMPVFVYGGRVLMKDFDILVPAKKQEEIAKTIGTPIKIKDSSVAFTKSSYVGESVETVSGLVVYSEGKKIPFAFDFLWEEVKFAHFLGVKVPIMGLEDLILFKSALGRIGTDDFGKHKDDLSDVEGLVHTQKINWKKLKMRAERLKMLDILEKKLKLLNITPLW